MYLWMLYLQWLSHPSIRFQDAFFYSIDGNFQQNQREKPMDAHDFPLTKGAAYFAHEDDFTRYQQTLGPLAPDVSFYLSKVSLFMTLSILAEV